MQRYIYLLLSFIQIFTCFAQNIATDDYIGFYQKFLSNQKTVDVPCIHLVPNMDKWPSKNFPSPKLSVLLVNAS